MAVLDQKFNNAWSELNNLGESWTSKAAATTAEREEAAKNFYAAGKDKLILDLDSFHKAFDDELKDLDLLDLFTDSGRLINRATYGTLKDQDKNNNAVKAIIKLWSFQFNDRLPTAEEKAERLKQLENSAASSKK